MIEGLVSHANIGINSYSGSKTAQPEKNGRVLQMTSSARTAGSMPSWQPAETAREKVQSSLSIAQAGYVPESFDSALSYAPSGQNTPKSGGFEFFDFLDMVNPLQHIPVVSQLYREFTGDQIKGPAQVVGGALFGGPVGAAAGFVNVLVENETGKNIGDHVFSLVKEQVSPPRQESEIISGQDFTTALLAYEGTAGRRL